jgi:hypothetical protein
MSVYIFLQFPERGKEKIVNHLVVFHAEFSSLICQFLPPGFLIVWQQKNKEYMLFAERVLKR